MSWTNFNAFHIFVNTKGKGFFAITFTELFISSIK